MNQPPRWPHTRQGETAHIVDMHTTDYLPVFSDLFQQIDQGMVRHHNNYAYRAFLDGGDAPLNDEAIFHRFDAPLQQAVATLYERLRYYSYTSDQYVLRIKPEAKTAIKRADGSYCSDTEQYVSVFTPNRWEVRHPPG